MRVPSVLPVALIALIILSACAAPRIDGRDADRTRASIADVRHSVPSEKQREFDSALRYLMQSAAAVPTLTDPRVRAALDGKSGVEIIAAAHDRRAAEDRKRDEERMQREKREIDSTLASIRRSDREAAAKIGAIAPNRAASTGAKPPALEVSAAAVAALAGTSTKYDGPVDDDVRSHCTVLASGRSDVLDICLRQEMEGKRAVTATLPAGVSSEIGQRVRDNCLRKSGDSYYARWACENTDVGSINNVSLHPEVMKTLRPERQRELHMLMGQ